MTKKLRNCTITGLTIGTLSLGAVGATHGNQTLTTGQMFANSINVATGNPPTHSTDNGNTQGAVSFGLLGSFVGGGLGALAGYKFGKGIDGNDKTPPSGQSPVTPDLQL